MQRGVRDVRSCEGRALCYLRIQLIELCRNKSFNSGQLRSSLGEEKLIFLLRLDKSLLEEICVCMKC